MTLPFERLLVGRTLGGRYRVDSVEGRGGMSVVFRAQDLTLGRPVALKVVALPATGEADAALLRERFRREAAAAASISRHPNVGQVHGYGRGDELGVDYIVMEMLSGSDLKTLLAQDGAPPLEVGLRILAEAARGVAAGHAAGIVHRDVKPGNIFLVGEEELEGIRVLDFGIAKQLGAEGDDEAGTLTRVGERPHSPAYASPEQLDPEGTVTPASDVYQLGLVAFETLTGDRPFTAADRERIRAGEVVAPVLPGAWHALPTAVRSVVLRALERDPAKRFADAGAFADALTAAADAPEEDTTRLQAPVFPTPLPADPAPPVPGRGLETRRFARLALIAAAAIVLLILLWAFLRGGSSPTPASTAGAADSVFLGLQGSVAGPAAGASAARAEPGTDAAADAIRGAVHDLNKAWVDGNLSRHVSHYASRVERYYNSNGLPRSGVRRDRLRELRRYAEMRRIDVGDIQVEFLDDGRARAVVRKSWEFRGSELIRSGSGVQEYIFKQDEDDGRWYVVSEQLLSQTEVRTPVS